MDASIYCIIIDEICESIAGRLSFNIRDASCLVVSFSPFRRVSDFIIYYEILYKN